MAYNNSFTFTWILCYWEKNSGPISFIVCIQVFLTLSNSYFLANLARKWILLLSTSWFHSDFFHHRGKKKYSKETENHRWRRNEVISRKVKVMLDIINVLCFSPPSFPLSLEFLICLRIPLRYNVHGSWNSVPSHFFWIFGAKMKLVQYANGFCNQRRYFANLILTSQVFGSWKGNVHPMTDITW